MKPFASFLLLVFLSGTAFAQTHFRIPDASENYDVEMTLTCEKDECGGPGEVRLFSKKTGKPFQTLHSDDLFFFQETNGLPRVNVAELYGDQSALVFADFNFDGHEDIAIRNGNHSSYHGPSYDIYVYSVTHKQFVPSKELTVLAYENLGLFKIDHERKRLITFSKSGCCWHLRTEYEVVPGKGLLKVFELEEDAMSGEHVKVTSRSLVKGKWVTRTKRVPVTEYYPEETTGEKADAQPAEPATPAHP